jgi:hypothetical protein
LVNWEIGEMVSFASPARPRVRLRPGGGAPANSPIHQFTNPPFTNSPIHEFTGF